MEKDFILKIIDLRIDIANSMIEPKKEERFNAYYQGNKDALESIKESILEEGKQ